MMMFCEQITEMVLKANCVTTCRQCEDSSDKIKSLGRGRGCVRFLGEAWDRIFWSEPHHNHLKQSSVIWCCKTRFAFTSFDTRAQCYEMLHLTWITKALATQWQPWLSIRFDDLPKLAFESLERSQRRLLIRNNYHSRWVLNAAKKGGAFANSVSRDV